MRVASSGWEQTITNGIIVNPMGHDMSGEPFEFRTDNIYAKLL